MRHQAGELKPGVGGARVEVVISSKVLVVVSELSLPFVCRDPISGKPITAGLLWLFTAASFD